MKNFDWAGLIFANMGKILGALAGLFIGFLFIRYGFWRGLFLLICTAAGVYIGSCLEKSQNWSDFLNHLWPPKPDFWK